MTLISLDQITKNILMKRGYPLQYYIQFLVYCKDGLREIAFDDKILATRYMCLPVNDNNAIELPNDYQDYTRVSVRIDQYIHPLVEDNSLQLVPNYDSEFNIEPYSNGVSSGANTNNSLLANYNYYLPYWWLVNWNMWGENTGRQFGGVSTSDTFRVNRARNEIKINEFLDVDEVLLEYISNGMDSDSATQIDGYAQMAIEAFAMWQFYLHNRTYSQAEANNVEEKYWRERQILRARLSDLTIDKLKRIVQQNQIRVKY